MPRSRPIRIRPAVRRTARPAGALGALLNLGPKSSAWLEAAGIRTRAQLEAVGPIEACRRIRAAGHPVSVVMAYALEGGLSGTHWNSLTPETKVWLRAEFARMRATEKRPGGLSA